MKVICAGFSKTGTKSIANALRVLGYNVYDTEEHWQFHMDEWNQAMETEKTPDFKAMYKGVDAVTDMPAYFYFERLHEAFPDAKVLLSIRDNEDQWLNSFIKTENIQNFEISGLWFMVAFLVTPTGRQWERLHRNMFKKHLMISESETDLAKIYLEHNARVQATIPTEKLLVYQVTQGWEPLCMFLGHDIPRIDFPRENINSKYIPSMIRDSNTLKKMFRELVLMLSVAVLVLATIGCFIFNH